MSLFDINFNIKAIEWLPPDKRGARMVAWVQSFLSGVQYSQKKILEQYRVGYTGQRWLPGFSYPVGATVLYKQVVYESLSSGNTDTPPSVNWAVYLPSFIGVNNRVLFNGQKLVLEAALNQYFFTHFRQPPLVPDIYIDTNAFEITGFIVGLSESNTCTVGGNTFTVKSGTVSTKDIGSPGISPWATGTYSYLSLVSYSGYLFLCINSAGTTQEPPDTDWLQVQTIGFNSPFLTGDNFTIYVPNATYTSIPNFESDCRQFVNKIIPAGLIYNIIPY